MKVIAFAPKYNTPGKHDATGAFQPEARRFMKYYDCGLPSLFDNHQSMKNMRASILRGLSFRKGLNSVAFFCHGSKKKIQCGFGLQHVNELATAIVHACDGAPNVTLYSGPCGASPIVPLYACDAGRDIDADRIDDLEAFGGDGGFADQLRDALCRVGAIACRLDAHTTVGHTDTNPNVRRFEGQGSPTGGVGGFYIVPFRSKLWKKWRAALKTDFRFQFPFMTATEIQDYLTKL